MYVFSCSPSSSTCDSFVNLVAQGLKLVQLHLATEKYLDAAHARIQALESEVEELKQERDARNAVGVVKVNASEHHENPP